MPLTELDWTEFRVVLPLIDESSELVFGVLLAGEGTVWADDIRLLVDGQPVNQAPRIVRESTILDADQEFNDGSGISLEDLTPSQIENLAVLGRVWGFLKYYHPRIAKRELHWDYELLRVIPSVLAASNRSERNVLLLEWGRRVGVPSRCDPCATASANAYLLADTGWINDIALLGEDLSAYLSSVHRNRHGGGAHFYVRTQANGAQNAVFDNELAYEDMTLPDAGFRLLALFRF